uniref:hypothetical protein n=1 Tax=uncultured Caulobacter sp. TaxID=158749 RepID=UPI0025F38648|nr:hypothetical protein [uncultured Caulobacter sp.]
MSVMKLLGVAVIVASTLAVSVPTVADAKERYGRYDRYDRYDRGRYDRYDRGRYDRYDRYDRARYDRGRYDRRHGMKVCNREWRYGHRERVCYQTWR